MEEIHITDLRKFLNDKEEQRNEEESTNQKPNARYAPPPPTIPMLIRDVLVAYFSNKQTLSHKHPKTINSLLYFALCYITALLLAIFTYHLLVALFIG